MSLSHFRIRSQDRFLAIGAILLLLPLLLMIAIGVRLETRRTIFRSAQRFLSPSKPVAVTFFQTRTLDGRLGTFGAMLKKTGLFQLPLLMDVCAGRLSFRDPMPRSWNNLAKGSWVGQLQQGQGQLARRKKDRYRSAA